MGATKDLPAAAAQAVKPNGPPGSTLDPDCRERKTSATISGSPGPLSCLLDRATRDEVVHACLTLKAAKADGIASFLRQAIQQFKASPQPVTPAVFHELEEAQCTFVFWWAGVLASRRGVRDQMDCAGDVSQTLMVELRESPEWIWEVNNPLGFLYRCTKRRVIDYVRRHKNESKENSGDTLDAETRVGQGVQGVLLLNDPEAQILGRELLQHISTLPAREQIAISNELSVKEKARLMGCSEPHVSNTKRAVVNRLRKSIMAASNR